MSDLGITGNLIAAILYDAAKGIYQGFNDPFNKALKDTSIYFLQEKDIEIRIGKLRKILEGDIAAEEIERFRTGEGFIDGDKLALQFAIFGELYFEDESEILPTAREIFCYFIKRFEYYLLEDFKTGLPTLASYIEIHRKQSSGEHSRIINTLHRVQEDIERLAAGPSPMSIRRVLEEIVKLPISEYISYDNQLQKLAKERGKNPQQLKDEIDEWIKQVKTPYEKGLAALYRQNYQEAQVYLRNFVETSETHVVAGYFLLGNAEFGNKEYEKAVTSYKTAVSINPGSALAHADIHYNLGLAYYEQGNLDEAIACYKESIRINTDLAAAHCNLGLVYQTQGKLDEAITCYKEAIRIDPSLVVSHFHLGSVYSDQGKLDLAIAEWRTIIRINPDLEDPYYNLLADAHFHLGLFYAVFQGKFEEAIACYKEAIRIDPNLAVVINPNLADAHYNLGLAYVAEEKFDEAVKEWQTVIRINPDFALAHYNLGYAYEDQGKFDEAAACYKNAITINPNLALAHCNLGGIYQKQDRLDEAVACCKKAITINPNLVEAHCNLGLAYAHQGKFDVAIACYKEAIAINPNFAEVHLNQGLAYKKQGRLDEAITCYKAAIRINPNLAEAHSSLGLAYASQRKLDEAIAAYEMAICLDPNLALAHCNLGLTYAHQGKMAQAYLNEGNFPAMKDYLEAAIRIDPDLAYRLFNRLQLTFRVI